MSLTRRRKKYTTPKRQHNVAIRELQWDEQPDAMSVAPWRREAFRFLFLTSIIPVMFGLFVSCEQVVGLKQYSDKIQLTKAELLVAWLIVCTEVLATVPNILYTILLARAFFGRWRRCLRLLGDNVPSVDVIITTCKESMDIVKDTIHAAMALDYPQDRYRIIIADDGSDAELKSWVEDMAQQSGKLQIHYVTRDFKSGYKAGNLNNAIQFSETLPGGPSGMIAGLDADMIPEKGWLRTIIPHLTVDHQLGVACPPQHFYNNAVNDPLHQSLGLGYRYTDLVRDMCGWAWNSGTGWVLRRKAIKDIGGFPTTCLVEDVHSSILMNTRGWKSAYVPEAVQFGLVPETYAAHIKQQTRWDIGHCQVSLDLGFYLFGDKAKRLSFYQRLFGFCTGVAAMINPLIAQVQIALAFVALVFGTRFTYATDKQLLRVLRFQCAMNLTMWLHQAHVGLIAGYQLVLKQPAGVDYMTPYYAQAILRSFLLPKWLGGKLTIFTATGTVSNNLHERDAYRRTPIMGRMKHIIWDCGAWYHLVVVILLSGAAAFRGYSIIHQADCNIDAAMKQLVVTVGWPRLTWFVTILGYMVPLWYMIQPPTVCDREKLLSSETQNGGQVVAAARYPAKVVKEQKWDFWGEIRSSQLYHIVLGYSALVLVGTFFSA